MNCKDSNADLRPRLSATRLLLCVPRSGAQALTRRLHALLIPHVESVAVSASLDEGMASALSLLVYGWGALDALAALHQYQLRFGTPVIAVVAHRRGSQISDLLRAGAADCVRWPVPGADAEILARVAVRLLPAAPEIRLEAASLTLTCCDVHARLTPTEFKVVHYLLANCGRWATSDEMTTAALQLARASRNLLRVHICSVRRKLKHESWRILTDRKFGYRFDISSSRAHLQVDESPALE